MGDESGASVGILCPLCARLDEAGPRPLTVTLDTNVPYRLWTKHEKSRIVEGLLDLADSDRVLLAVTRYIRADIPAGELVRRVNALPELKVFEDAGGLFTLDESTLDGPDFLGSGEFEAARHALSGWRPTRGKPPDERDWKHLHAHYAQQRDMFLTWDEALLELAQALEDHAVFVRAVKPEVFLALFGHAPAA